MFNNSNGSCFKKGQHPSLQTEFKKGHVPWCMGKPNLAIRGDKNPAKRPEVKLKIVETRRKNNSYIQSNETKEKISLSVKNFIQNNPNEVGFQKGNKHFLGLRHSEEAKKKISLANKGRKHSEEARAKMKLTRLKQIMPFRDTSIEIRLQDWLKEQNIEFETHYSILGQPDIFIKPNICIFADGCYWHKCPDCGFGHKRERDEMVTGELQKQGYTVIRLWEHDIKNNQFNSLNQLLKC